MAIPTCAHLAPAGVAGFVLANGSMYSNQPGEGEIRKAIIEADLVDCMVALPGQLFYSTQIPACLWFLCRNKKQFPSPAGRGGRGEGRDRRGEILFIDARKMGRMIDRTHRELTDEDIQKIAQTYHAWRGETVGWAGLVHAQMATTRVTPTEYRDIPGLCKSPATRVQIAFHENTNLGLYWIAEPQ